MPCAPACPHLPRRCRAFAFLPAPLPCCSECAPRCSPQRCCPRLVRLCTCPPPCVGEVLAHYHVVLACFPKMHICWFDAHLRPGVGVPVATSGATPLVTPPPPKNVQNPVLAAPSPIQGQFPSPLPPPKQTPCIPPPGVRSSSHIADLPPHSPTPASPPPTTPTT